MRENIIYLRRTCTALALTCVVLITLWSSLMHLGEQSVTMVPNTTPVHVPASCWTGGAPKGVTIPGHVWAVIPGGDSGIFGAYWTGKALDQMFGKNPTFGLTVMAFCR